MICIRVIGTEQVNSLYCDHLCYLILQWSLTNTTHIDFVPIVSFPVVKGVVSATQYMDFYSVLTCIHWLLAEMSIHWLDYVLI